MSNMLQPGSELYPATNQTYPSTAKMDLAESTTYAASKTGQPQPTTNQPGKETRKDERVASEGSCIHSNLLQVAFVFFIFISMI